MWHDQIQNKLKYLDLSIRPAGRDNACLTATLQQLLSAPGVQLYGSPCALTSLHCGASEKKIPFGDQLSIPLLSLVHLGMSGGSKGQSPELQHREGPPVWREALRRHPPSTPAAIAGGVWQHAAGTREVPALFRRWRDHIGEHRWSQSGRKG